MSPLPIWKADGETHGAKEAWGQESMSPAELLQQPLDAGGQEGPQGPAGPGGRGQTAKRLTQSTNKQIRMRKALGLLRGGEGKLN